MCDEESGETGRVEEVIIEAMDQGIIDKSLTFVSSHLYRPSETGAEVQKTRHCGLSRGVTPNPPCLQCFPGGHVLPDGEHQLLPQRRSLCG